ncbi:MAG TPA: 2-octaprenyl-6-methoxyphenyl hydroxylase [Gammaproteobacteria bacterium]|nr:2-octaprenyl-6-methoxyphenyl hydroxylase [Gammaproteobacteria bacterium]
MKHYDAIIAGGGMVGACLVRALSGQGLRIASVEAVRREIRDEPGYDDRAIALAYGTRRIFSGLNLWHDIEAEATPIHSIHVSDRGHFGAVHMDCTEEGLPAIGYVVPARVIGQVLANAAGGLADVDSYCPANVVSTEEAADDIRVVIEAQGLTETVTARLVVAADGADSVLRERAGIDSLQTDYGQTAIVTNITPQLPHHNIAYERFTDSGPLAILPMSEGRCAVVWTVASAQADTIMALGDAAFLGQLQERFGQRLGRLTRAGRRQAWPLRLLSARRSVAGRLALVGNAIHTLHPIAGQGFNLGARDVAVLAEVIVDAVHAGEDPGSASVLARYAEWRRRDHANVTVFTDGLARLFTLPVPGLGVARSAGMVALDLLPPAKRLLTRLTMGRSGRMPRLSRGLPL